MNRESYRVLHVDDDPAMTALVSQLMRRNGIACDELNDPTKAMSLIRDGNYRVVILDLDMPELHGLELLQQIKEYDGGINVVILTGVVLQSSVVRSLRRGASACVFKPLHDPQLLLETIHLAFENIDRWWNTLRELTVLRRGYASPFKLSDGDVAAAVAKEAALENATA